MKKITVAMLKRVANKDCNVRDEMIPICEEALKNVAKKWIPSKYATLKDIDPQVAFCGLFIMVMLGNELSEDRKRRFIEAFYADVVKEAMTPAAYKKYSADLFGENFWKDFPELSNEEFDSWFTK